MDEFSTITTATAVTAARVEVELTSLIVAAYVGSHTVSIAELPTVIKSVHSALTAAGVPAKAFAEPEKLVPAVPIKKSITPDYLVCLEDGKQLKMLKRHLNTTYGLSPDDYRAKWGLPPDYPMVAPNYAAQRSSLAKSIGLGRRPVEAAEVIPPKKAGRPKKSAA